MQKRKLEKSEMRLRGEIQLFRPENSQTKSPETGLGQANARNVVIAVVVLMKSWL